MATQPEATTLLQQFYQKKNKEKNVSRGNGFYSDIVQWEFFVVRNALPSGVHSMHGRAANPANQRRSLAIVGGGVF